MMTVKMIQDLGKRKEKMQELLTKNLELKHKETEMKNTPEGINSRITDAERQTRDLEDRMMKITASRWNIEKKKEEEESLRDLWDNIKCSNFHIIQVPEGEE